MKNRKTWLLLLSCAGGIMGNAAAAPPPATAVSEAELRACGHGKEREIAGPPASKPSIKMVSVSPADSSNVSRDSTVVAEIEYSVGAFEPGMYQVTAQFETTDPRVSTGGTLQELPELQYAHGTLRFCYPLRAVWSMPQVRFPLALNFNLTKRNDDGSTSVIARSPVTHFSAVDLSAASALAAPSADQLAMREAVQAVNGMLGAIELHAQLCAEAFPDMKSSLLPPLQAWQKRYAKLKEKSDALFLDMVRQQFPGITSDGVLRVLEGQRTSFKQQIASVPEAVSPNNCAQLPGRFTDGSFDPAQRIPEAYKRVSSYLSP
jgi:hypothetical protein